MKAAHATSHNESTHKRRASCKATQPTGPDMLVKKNGARKEHDGKRVTNGPSQVAQGNFLTSPRTTQVVHLLVNSTTFWLDSRSTEADASFMQCNRLGGLTAEVRPGVKHWSRVPTVSSTGCSASSFLLDVKHNFVVRF